MAKNKIKIIYIINDLRIGGAERFLVDLVNNFDQKIFEPKIVLLRDRLDLKDELNRNIPITIIGKKTKLGLGTICKIRRYLKNEKPQIVHTQLFGGDIWGRIGAILARVPIIVSTEQNTNYDQSLLHNLAKIILAKWTDKIVAISKSVRDFSFRFDKVNPEKIIIIPNGVEISKFNPVVKKNKKPVLISVARLAEQKGHIYTIKALNKIKKLDWTYWIVGEGDLERKLKNEVRKCKLTGNIKFLGKRKDINQLLGKSDIFIMNSLWEGLGIAAIEASLMELPCIVSNIGGLNEVVVDGKTGFLTMPKDINGISEKIKKLILNQSLMKKMGKEGRKYVIEKFSIKNVAKRYQDLYLSLIK